jgi:exopolyphosphatase / guanosine-5'-triphosphate,3'-diphosphate pyrophosphatase
MEIVLGRDAEPDLAVTLPLGAGRLTRMHLKKDPPPAKQARAMRRDVHDTLREVSDGLRWEGVPGERSAPRRP